jgi:peptidoglycan/LPS O-acetylase OafA/YrhL
MRGLAALAVIYTHAAQYGVHSGLITSQVELAVFTVFTEYMDLGKVAVTVFFAISGFVIPFSIYRYKSNHLASFYIGRFFRLYPAYWVSIPLGLVFLYYLKDKPVSPSLVLANITMLEQFVGIEPILGLYWTLQIEIIFYGLCGLLFAFNRLNDSRTVTGAAVLSLAMALVMSAARYKTGIKLPVALPLAICVMFWGLCIRYSLEEKRSEWATPLKILTIALVLLIPVISLLAYNTDMGFGETWYKYTITYYVAFLSFYILYRRIRITSAPFAYLGTISYSVYLFGIIVQEALLSSLGNALYAFSGHVAILAIAVLTVLLSSCIYFAIEAPSIELGRYLIRRLPTPLNEKPAPHSA